MWILIGDPTIKLEQPQSQGKCPIWNGTAKEPADRSIRGVVESIPVMKGRKISLNCFIPTFKFN